MKLASQVARLGTQLQGMLQEDFSSKLDGEDGLQAHSKSGISQTTKATADLRAELLDLGTTIMAEVDRGVKAEVFEAEIISIRTALKMSPE